jgi:hypothetical protein
MQAQYKEKKDFSHIRRKCLVSLDLRRFVGRAFKRPKSLSSNRLQPATMPFCQLEIYDRLRVIQLLNLTGVDTVPTFTISARKAT